MPSDERHEEIFETGVPVEYRGPIDGSDADEVDSEGQVGPRCVIFDSAP
jgi:hypothetical protein